MLGGMMLYRLFSRVRRVSKVTVRDMRVVAGLHMIACFMMLRGFPTETGTSKRPATHALIMIYQTPPTIK